MLAHELTNLLPNRIVNDDRHICVSGQIVGNRRPWVKRIGINSRSKLRGQGETRAQQHLNRIRTINRPIQIDLLENIINDLSSGKADILKHIIHQLIGRTGTGDKLANHLVGLAIRAAKHAETRIIGLRSRRPVEHHAVFDHRTDK